MFLKENGGLLNSIRPYFLLSYQDYLNYIKIDPAKDHVALSCLRIREIRFYSIQTESRVQLTNQIVKIFYLSRVTLKPQRSSHLPFPPLPDHFLLESNLYSKHEVMLIHWLESMQKHS